MALTRKMLEVMGIEEKVIDQIIESHSATVDGLKDEIAKYKAEADKVEDLEKQLKEATSNTGEDFKEKYEAEHKAFEEYKSEIASKETQAKKQSMYRDLLKDAGIDEKRINSVLRVTDLSELEFNQDGSIKGADKLKDQIREDWADFVVKVEDRGANVDNPPGSTGNTMSKKEILQIKDPGGLG